MTEKKDLKKERNDFVKEIEKSQIGKEIYQLPDNKIFNAWTGQVENLEDLEAEKQKVDHKIKIIQDRIKASGWYPPQEETISLQKAAVVLAKYKRALDAAEDEEGWYPGKFLTRLEDTPLQQEEIDRAIEELKK